MKHTQTDAVYLSFPLFFLLNMRVRLCYDRWRAAARERVAGGVAAPARAGSLQSGRSRPRRPPGGPRDQRARPSDGPRDERARLPGGPRDERASLPAKCRRPPLRWEARSLWGLTISRSRNLARLAILYLPRQDRPRFCALIVAWAVAKKRHLRDERTMLLELADVLGPCDRRDAATAKHPPLWFLDALSRYVAETEAAGGMDSQQAQCFHDQHQWPSGC